MSDEETSVLLEELVQAIVKGDVFLSKTLAGALAKRKPTGIGISSSQNQSTLTLLDETMIVANGSNFANANDQEKSLEEEYLSGMFAQQESLIRERDTLVQERDALRMLVSNFAKDFESVKVELNAMKAIKVDNSTQTLEVKTEAKVVDFQSMSKIFKAEAEALRMMVERDEAVAAVTQLRKELEHLVSKKEKEKEVEHNDHYDNDVVIICNNEMSNQEEKYNNDSNNNNNNNNNVTCNHVDSILDMSDADELLRIEKPLRRSKY